MKYLEKFTESEAVAHLLLERRAADAPDALFFSFLDERWTLGDFNTRTNRVARNLQARGVQKGTHVLVLMDTSVDYMLLWFALSKIGAVEVPVNTAYRGDLLRHVVETSRATVCVMDQRFEEIVAAAYPEGVPFRQSFVKGEGGSFCELHEPAGEANLDNAISYDEIAGVIFTSGTTGPSKGVMLSHRYLCAYGLMYAEINALRDDDVVLNFLPFFHIGAKFLTIAVLACGGAMRLQPRLSISTFWGEVRAHRITNFVGVGGICNMLVSRPESPDDADTTIRTIYAVPDPSDIHTELERRFRCRITTVYGSTEVGLPIFRAATDEYVPGSCGRASPYYDVQVVDENDNPVPTGVSGEIVVRPKRPYLIGSGYIGMPQRTVEAWRNLWLHSGDRGRVDENGWFFFEDRANDSLRRRGENISSFEVEQLVAKHPAVAEAVAVAAPSEVGEDEVRVLVTLREGKQLLPDELLQHCYREMPYFMVPRFIDIVEDFPRTATAKVEKYKIRTAGFTDKTWDCQGAGWRVTRHALERV